MIHNNINKQIAEGVKELRKRIDDAKIPPSKLDETLNIASWNIREFGKNERKPAAIHYIAEILSQFDLITIVEVRDNLADLYMVMEILGNNYKVMFSDFNTDSAGNRERLAFLYDIRAVTFTGLAAESDPYRTKDKTTGQYVSDVDWWRSPYMASFRSGNFDFILLAAHIRWGDNPASRIPELQKLAEWVDNRSSEKYTIDKDIIVVGDFNTPKLDDALFKALAGKGLTTPKKLREARGTDLAQTKHYDHILHNPRYTKSFKDEGGVLDFYKKDWQALFPASDYTGMNQADFTFQMSDHLPVWVQINTWIDDEQLDQFLAKQK
jgi:endonuclease/exonuclease/phosphatase family metal-dependent hydrolase